MTELKLSTKALNELIEFKELEIVKSTDNIWLFNYMLLTGEKTEEENDRFKKGIETSKNNIKVTEENIKYLKSLL